MISDNSGGWNSYNTHLSLIYVQHESRVEKHVSRMYVLEKKKGVFTGDDAKHQNTSFKVVCKNVPQVLFFFFLKQLY